MGTGKYRSFGEMQRAHEASGADMVTVAVRRVNLTDRTKESLLDYVDPRQILSAAEYGGLLYGRRGGARRAAGTRGGALALGEAGSDRRPADAICPDTAELIRAGGRILVKEGFVVLPYTSDDLIVARRLVDAGAAAVMPLGAPIGSGLGIQNMVALRILRERITEVPLIVDAGVGTASDAAVAMEMGADGVLMNTAIAEAEDAVMMASAMRHAVLGGREAFLAGRMAKRLYASASSPVAGVVR